VTKAFPEKYLKKLMGKNNIEHALKRLDRLTQEEARMASAQLLQITNAIDERVAGVDERVANVDERVASVDERVAGVDERVAGVDERVAGVNERVAGVDERVSGVDERVAGVNERVSGVDERVAGVNERVAGVDERVVGVDERVAGVADVVDRIERSWFPNRIHAGHTGSIILTGDQLQQNLRRWLSPPDPSTNHNIACNAHHKGTAHWFFEGRTYKEWKSISSESLLWVHGKRVPRPILPSDAT
jgi:archaellum component FlaC